MGGSKVDPTNTDELSKALFGDEQDGQAAPPELKAPTKAPAKGKTAPAAAASKAAAAPKDDEREKALAAREAALREGEAALLAANAAAVQAKPVVDKTPEPAKEATKAKGKMIRIMIDDVNGKQNYEVVSVNGKVWQLQRGVPVDVPYEVVHILENAVETVTTQVQDRVTGELINRNNDRGAVPWRRM